MNEEVREAVERGAKWLDKVYPGWELLIDVDELDLQSSCRCVLGQLYDELAQSDTEASFDGYSGYDFGVSLLYRDLVPQGDYSERLGSLGYLPRRYGFLSSCTIPENKFEPEEKTYRERFDESYQELDELWIELIKGRLNAGIKL